MEPKKQSFIYHVYSGLDAFIVRVNDKVFYMPYIAVIAETEEDARKQVADFLGISLDDQNTNPSYENYVSDHVVKVGTF